MSRTLSSESPVDLGVGVDATVIVCTYNRAESLRRTLQCLANQKVRDDLRWEVLVIDNNSTDDTRMVIDAARGSFDIPLRYQFEGRQGLSNARNLGIQYARGRILLFTDDDVCPAENWVEEIVDGLENHGSDAGGGYIAPRWEEPPPAWLTERFFGFLALRTDDAGPHIVTSVEAAPFGANMAFRRSVFEEFGDFDIRRGRMGNVLAAGEELDLFQRLLEGGGKIVYLPNARVEHFIERFRLRKSYFRRWRFQASRNIAESEGVPGTRRLFGIPLYVFGQLLAALRNTFVARFRLPADEAFFKEMIVWHFLGLMRGLYAKQSRKKTVV